MNSRRRKKLIRRAQRTGNADLWNLILSRGFGLGRVNELPEGKRRAGARKGRTPKRKPPRQP